MVLKKRTALRRWLELDLTEEARQGRLEPAFCRDALVAAAGQLLAAGRSPVLVGPPGVGKTSVVHELVRRAASGDDPAGLAGRRVLQLSISRGASTLTQRDAIGSRFLELLEELEGMKEPFTVYLRDLHLAWDFDLEEHIGGLCWGVEGPILAEGEARGVRSVLELEPHLERHLSLLEVGEPSLAETRELLHRWAAASERRRGIAFAPEALDTAFELAHRFLVRSRFPRKVIDPLSQLTAAARRGRRVTEEEVVELFGRQYGLPAQLVDRRSALDLAALEASLRGALFGQPEAIAAVVEMIGRVKAGLLDPRRPLGTFLFVGPAGVGKTHLARLVAERLLGSSARLVRLNMADYGADAHAAVLLGDPASRHPAERRGILAERILGCQLGVLLLDELEKASPRVHDAFLQLLDEGVFQNGAGETVSVRSLVVIATSNAGAELWLDTPPGFRPAHDGSGEEQLDQALRRRFRFELLNRFDRVVTFRPLSRQDVRALLDAEIRQLERRSGLARRSLRLELDESVRESLLAEGHHPKHGVRFLRQTVERRLTAPLARLLLDHPPAPGTTLRLRLEEGELAVAPAERFPRVAVRSA